MNHAKEVEDTIVGLQREQWLAEMSNAGPHHHVTLWTHEVTRTTAYAEEIGGRITTSNCNR